MKRITLSLDTHMRKILKYPLLTFSILFTFFVVLVCCARLALYSGFDPRQNYDQIQIGVTTEAKVEEMFGPAIVSTTDVITPSQASRLGVSQRADGQPIIVTYKQWWYNDDHYFQLTIDERAVVVRNSGLCRTGHKSPIIRWWRYEVKPFLSKYEIDSDTDSFIEVISIAILFLVVGWVVFRIWNRKQRTDSNNSRA